MARPIDSDTESCRDTEKIEKTGIVSNRLLIPMHKSAFTPPSWHFDRREIVISNAPPHSDKSDSGTLRDACTRRRTFRLVVIRCVFHATFKLRAAARN